MQVNPIGDGWHMIEGRPFHIVKHDDRLFIDGQDVGPTDGLVLLDVAQLLRVDAIRRRIEAALRGEGESHE